MSIYMVLLIWTFRAPIPSHSVADALDWDRVRSAYPIAVKDKELCSTLIQELSVQAPMEETEHALLLAYRGGFQTIWANHVFSPMAKLRTFNQGKENIERAVSIDPDSPEIRYIRLSVQKNAPGFLGYRGAIEKDTEFLRNNQERISSLWVKHHLARLLGNNR